ncbi:MAG: helix-turn-helix domain-containing protein [Thermoguttaceae bacterium]|jgi:hypothetical protein
MASHLTLEEREIIAHMHRAGKMQAQIADRLGRSKSTMTSTQLSRMPSATDEEAPVGSPSGAFSMRRLPPQPSAHSLPVFASLSLFLYVITEIGNTLHDVGTRVIL